MDVEIQEKPRSDKIFLASSAVTSTPISFLILLKSNAIFLLSDFLPTILVSLISPPQISRINFVAKSIPLSQVFSSTPRSKRNLASDKIFNLRPE